MILKWQSPTGNWQLKDNVSDITYYGWHTTEEIVKKAKHMAGGPVYLQWTLDADSEAVANNDDKYQYLTAVISGSVKHIITDAYTIFVLSDIGKTVDKLQETY